MDKWREQLERWRTATPPQADKEDVSRVLKYYFGEHFREAGGGSHQFRVPHPGLYREHPFDEGVTLSIPVTNGRYVKRIYLKRIIQAVDIVIAKENTHEDTGRDEE